MHLSLLIKLTDPRLLTKILLKKNKTSDFYVLNNCIYVLFIWPKIPMCWVIVYLIVIVGLYCYTLLYSMVLCRIQIVGGGGVFNADIVETPKASLTHYCIQHRTMLFCFVFLFVCSVYIIDFIWLWGWLSWSLDVSNNSHFV